MSNRNVTDDASSIGTMQLTDADLAEIDGGSWKSFWTKVAKFFTWVASWGS